MSFVPFGSMLTDCGHQRQRFKCLYGSVLKVIAHDLCLADSFPENSPGFSPGGEIPLSEEDFYLANVRRFRQL